MRGPFRAVRGRAIGCHVEGLVRVVRVVEVVRRVEQVLRADVPIYAAKERSVVDHVVYWRAFVLIKVCLIEVHQHLPLAVAIGVDLRVRDIAAKYRIRDATWR